MTLLRWTNKKYKSRLMMPHLIGEDAQNMYTGHIVAQISVTLLHPVRGGFIFKQAFGG